MACCSLVTWAETKRVRHAAIKQHQYDRTRTSGCTAAAAAAKSPQSCPTLCDPRDGSPPGSTVPGILQARTLEWVAISFSQLQIPIARMAQVPPCSGIRRSISCLFWSTSTGKLCWLFRAVLRNLNPRNRSLGVFIRMALIRSSE